MEERELFHGTTEMAINAIADVGFDPIYNKTSAYGKGTYFARDAKYSYNYMRPNKAEISYMFVADVIIGRMIQGSPNLTIPSTHDTAVDSPTKPSIFVTPYRYGACPTFIIAFHKNAK